MGREIWKDIEGYEGLYQVSSWGRVRSLDRYAAAGPDPLRLYPGRILRPKPVHTGYLRVALSRAGGQRQVYIHRLVAHAFLDRPTPGQEVNHKDGDKSNNRASNLEWVTKSKNHQHAYATGLRSSTGENNGNARLAADQVRAIRREYAAGGISQEALGRRYGVGQPHIGRIVRREAWTNV